MFLRWYLSQDVKVDSQKELKWTFYEFKRLKVDDPEVWKWPAQKYESGRSKSAKVDGPKVFKSTVQTFEIVKVDGLNVLMWTA